MRVSWCLFSSTITQILKEAKACEVLGLDGIWFPDYQAPFSQYQELFVTLTSLALNVKQLFIGSLVTDVLRRHPMVVAHGFASLSYISPAGLILGLGAGAGSSHIPYGIKMNNLARKLEEGITVIRMLWEASEENPAYYKGKFFSLERAGSPLKPRRKIPIYVASYGPKMLKITAKLADGWVPESHTPYTYRKTLRKMHSMMDSFGRERDSLEPCLATIFYPFEPDEKAYRRIISAAKHYLATYPDIQWTAGYGAEHPGLRTQHLMDNKDLWSKLAERVPDELADSTIIYGSAQECVERILKFREAGCKHIILEPFWIEKEKVKEALMILGKKIKPKLKIYESTSS